MLNESLPNFEVMATTIKNQARWRCQHCHRPCRRPGETNMAFFLRIEEQFPEWEDELWEEWIDEEFGVVSIPKPGRFILTVVRLGSTSNHSGDGPAAICSVCCHRHNLPPMEAKSVSVQRPNGHFSIFQQHWEAHQKGEACVLPNLQPFKVQS